MNLSVILFLAAILALGQAAPASIAGRPQCRYESKNEEKFDLAKFALDYGKRYQEIINSNGVRAGDILQLLGSSIAQLDKTGEDVCNYFYAAADLLNQYSDKFGNGRTVQEILTDIFGK